MSNVVSLRPHLGPPPIDPLLPTRQAYLQALTRWIAEPGRTVEEVNEQAQMVANGILQLGALLLPAVNLPPAPPAEDDCA